MTATAQGSPGPVRHRLLVAGVVQGVGFRPHTHRLATALGLAGHVGNDADGVFVEVEGPEASVTEFEGRLVRDAPALARVDRLDVTAVPVAGGSSFRIVASRGSGRGRTFVSPDIATCADCSAEVADPGDRRYRYPFTNCTACGPRFTITVALPYDRPNTTMSRFAMCADCSGEYHDPGDRRFHAQPLACPACGPRLWFEGPAGRVPGTDGALAAAQEVLAAGGTVAVKGLGGYHLACDARSSDAVGRLRQRKHRPDKPLAVMAPDLAAAAELAVIGAPEAALLEGRQRPIVLLRSKPGTAVSPLVAPGSAYLGLLLPYTPLHHLLLAPVPGAPGPAPRVLVMTSGNGSDEPICYDDDDARLRLAGLADGWLVHDRPIHVPCDDSVVRADAGGESPVRRSRGYAPLPVTLPFETASVLAVGGELKNTFCLAAGRDAWVSQHIGDMGAVETLDAFERSSALFTRVYGIRPALLAADAHPGYQTRRWAEQHGDTPVELVQHHHAHVAAVMAENGVASGERIVGVAFDGTGYGSDGAIWGGEWLVASYARCERAAHLSYVALPGGDATIRRPYRSALAHLRAAGVEWSGDLAPVAAARPGELGVVERQLARGFACTPTSSAGRLFDAVSSLLGVCQVVSYEAQAAIELEALAEGGLGDPRRYRFPVPDPDGAVDTSAVLRAIVADVRGGAGRASIAAGFHFAVARMIAGVASRLARGAGLGTVGLSGGVFQNQLLTRLCRAELAGGRLEVLSHHCVPTNDGGLALGQAAVAGCRLAGTGRSGW